MTCVTLFLGWKRTAEGTSYEGITRWLALGGIRLGRKPTLRHPFHIQQPLTCRAAASK